ncbi:phytoene desaturase family protein [Streptomyces coelicoflavus]|uniref:phytoene desaturase family protein n=1 Tax=Streptomyces coelicoflavus TaxID=285562 RepID=UPI003676BF55
MSAADAAVVGTGPNGLAAAVTLARTGLRVELYEAADEIGGGLRSRPLFDPDVVHDICSAVHPLAGASRFFREFDLAARGVELLQPELVYAHPLPDGPPGLAHRDLARTCAGLGPDGRRWRRLMAPLVERGTAVVDLVLAGGRALPDDPISGALLAARALAHASRFVPDGFTTDRAAALLTGVAAHAGGPLPSLPSAGVAMLLGQLAHGSGWPLPRGGSASIARALAADIRAHGGVLHTGTRIDDLRDLAAVPLVLLDTSPKEFLRIAGDRLPPGYVRRLRAFRYGPAAAKVDFLVSRPVPWRNPEIGRAGTVHLGGTRAEMYQQETLTARGVPTGSPFVLVVEPAATDPGRSRPGKHPVWAYAHVPHGDGRDPAALVTRRIERYAPGFGDTVIAHRAVSGEQLEAYNPNYVGGDIGAGAMTLRQSLLRPTVQLDPYRTPLRGVYLCSASTPPGPGVHGMSGYLAALSALRRIHGVRSRPSLAPRPTEDRWGRTEGQRAPGG